RKFVVLAHGSIFSKVGASSKPGAIQDDFLTSMKAEPQKEKALISRGFFSSYLEARAGVEPA
ncbi:hypothetical protein, partial [Burkholderia multivorans]|uniref:hypothetical protein n=1 Tax=Burkholderia multivorans TaxID=87883 RepID=UPI00286FDCDD